MVAGQKTKMVNKLVAAVRLDKKTSAATQAVAEEAARQLEASLLSIETLLATLRDARETRDALMPVWDKALAALRRGARAATDEDAPGLYVALFGTPSRSRKSRSGDVSDKSAAVAA